jgi:putative ABC transport system permease protein
MAPPLAYVNYDFFTQVVRETGRTRGLWITTEQHDLEGEDEAAGILEAQFKSLNLRIRSLDTLGEQRLFMEFHFDILTGFFMVMAMILAAVGAMGLAGTMSINVMERIREFGVMRAIGASDGAVKRLVIVEGVVIALLSWAISVIGGFPMGNIISNAVGRDFLDMPLIYVVTPNGIVLWLGIVIVLAVVAGFLPARSASRLTVREVLAYE